MKITMEKLTGAIVVINLFLAIVGAYALAEYKRANMEAISARITQMDREMYTMSANDDKLESIFAYYPEATTVSEVKENSRKLLSLSVDRCFRDQIPEFESIDWLYDYIWSAEEYDDKPYKSDLRKASTHSDLILYVVAEAHSAYKNGLMNENDYKTWAAYVHDVGRHPLFLVSIYSAHEAGYFDRDFAYEIREILTKNNRTRLVVETLYPEMINDAWPEEVGKDYIKNHVPQGRAK